MEIDLLYQIRQSHHTGREKNTAYENSADKDQFIDDEINEMNNVDLIQAISWAIEER